MKQEIKTKWYTRFFPRFFRRQVISDSSNILPHPAAVALEWEQKALVKEMYTSGCEYFLFTGDIDPRRHQLMVLLKAFSQFKKWQRSDMKLVIAGNTTRRTKELKQKLGTYKYKEDVIIAENPEPAILLNIIAACYLMIYFDNKDIFPANILNAFQSQVPVVAGDTPQIAKEMGQRGLLIASDNHEGLAEQMLRFYKDEHFRSGQINSGLSH